ncbi:tandem-95 repeat protein [Candidatus Woesearchaeota archaeon]|nr:tandem-95 repeat protein [Candidatus Woesearchaeota archaeon]
MEHDQKGRTAATVIIAALLALSAILVMAAGTAPYFTPIPPSLITCYQNSTCFYDFNATDAEADPINFSINKPPLSNYINPTTGVLNFTPTNDDVGRYNYTWAIVQETDTGNGTFAIITWVIVNINDPPNITSYLPENLTNITVKEGAWMLFNITADDIDIKHGDTLNYTWMINGTVNRTLLNYTNNESNYTPDYFSAGVWQILVNVSDNQSAWTYLNWTVNVTNENRAPINNATIPNVTMLEDGANYSVYNLRDYFYDLDLDDYPLSYLVTGNQNVTVIIDPAEPHNVTFIPYPNFFGTNTIQFICDDGYNTTDANNTVTVNVTGVNDLPVIQQVPNQTAYADTLYQLQIQASDPDLEPVTCYDNATIFDINPTTCFISDIFHTSEIGNYSVEINASDGKANTSMIFNLTVINNTAPVLGGKPLQDVLATEGIYTYLEFNATDVDLTDLLNFTTNTTGPNPKFSITTTNTSPLGAKGYIAFTPDQSDVLGSPWYVTVTVNDSKGATDQGTFMITVSDVEHYPLLIPYPIPNQRMKVNLTFTMDIRAYDEDANLHLFGDNTTLFNISTLQGAGPLANKTGRISFTPNDSYFGEHWVNITINDTTSRHNWSLTLFNVTYNTPPDLQPIPDQNATEDFLFTYQVLATDPDPQDSLTYYDNTTLFNISNTTGLISFTPNMSQTGAYIINITVSDGEVNVSTLMNITIGEYNDYPYWNPSLDRYFTNASRYINTTIWTSANILNYSTNMTVWNSSIYEKNLTLIYMDAYDEETTTLWFSITYINFTNASNDTVTTGINLINFTSYDGDTALANLTPNNSEVGVYYINFSVDDTTGRVNTTTIRLKVYNVNDAPVIVNYSPNVTYYVNMTENSSMLFNVTAVDPDYGDTIRYQWALNGTNISGANQSSYTYNTDFFSAGWRNVSVLIRDSTNTTTTLNWTVNVSNVNRLGWFGEIRQYNKTHFDLGATKTNVTVLPGELGVILYNTGTGYRPSGLFESNVLDTYETNYYHRFTNISWAGNTTPPPGANYNIYFQARTAEGITPTTCPTTISDPYNTTFSYYTSGANLTVDDDRCIQYRFFMATNDTTQTPSINSVAIGYAIADRSQEQNTNQSWIDLDSYFFDLDTDDNITFNVTGPNGTAITDVNITIDNSTHRVYVLTNSVFVGSVELVFHMFDSYNQTDSNIIVLNVTEAESFPEVIIVPVGGGGSVSQPVPYEVPKYVTAPVSFRLIAPQAVTMYVNETMEVPINLFNSNFTMENIRLKATTPNENIEIKLSRDFIPRLEPNQKDFITLFVDSYKTYGTYEILIEATADAISVAEDGTEKKSEFTEKAKIFINSLLKAEGNESQVNTKLAFAEDLLSSNPECLELNEFLKKAKQKIQEKQTEEAGKMLDQVVESCKYLIAPREEVAIEEEPTKVYGMPTESVFILSTVAIVTLIVAIALVIGWTHLKAKKRELTRRKEGP